MVIGCIGNLDCATGFSESKSNAPLPGLKTKVAPTSLDFVTVPTIDMFIIKSIDGIGLATRYRLAPIEALHSHLLL